MDLCRAADNQPPAKESEAKLIEVLRTGSSPDKAIACKKLAVYGSKDAVPELAPLLADEQLASWGSNRPGSDSRPRGRRALRKATDSLKGRLLVGTINSIGVRRDAEAVDRLNGWLADADQDVAAAAAVALGRIGNATATKALRQSLPTSAGPVRNAVAEGCILCAERLMNEGKSNEAGEIYDEVRKADVPKQKKARSDPWRDSGPQGRRHSLARRAASVARQSIFQHRPRHGSRAIGPGSRRGAAAGELSKTAPERAAILLRALADRNEPPIPAAVLIAAKSGPRPVRIAAIDVIGRLGDARSLSTLLDIAAESDDELSQAAKGAVLVALPGQEVNSEIAAATWEGRRKHAAGIDRSRRPAAD